MAATDDDQGEPPFADDEYGLPHIAALAAAFDAHNRGDSEAWLQFPRHWFRPPAWFDARLPPDSQAFRDQQDRLWREVTARDRAHDAAEDEQTPEVAAMDWRTRPGLYGMMVHEAADHLLAMGQILKHSGLRYGTRMIEYGPGFGQIALALARLGVQCSVVDVNPHFITAIERQAEMYSVQIRTLVGEFGDAPEGDGTYDLILFYEAFHHSRDPLALLRRLKSRLTPGGRIMLAGEPIYPIGQGIMFTPWGLRGARDAMAVMRGRGWYEGGFDPDWLGEAFAREGFRQVIHDGAALSPCATVHEYVPDADAQKLADAFAARWRKRLAQPRRNRHWLARLLRR